jgi:hypothetical protein
MKGKNDERRNQTNQNPTIQDPLEIEAEILGQLAHQHQDVEQVESY